MCGGSDEEPEALAEHAADVKANGPRDKITFTPDDLLLDGKNRVRACELAGIEITPEMIEVHHGDPLAFVISKNDQRRHMTERQRRAVRAQLAAYAAEMALPLGANQHTEGLATAKPSKEAAKATGIPSQDISYIRAIEKRGTPAEIEAVKTGKAPLRKTADVVNSRARAERLASHKTKSASVDPIADVACELIAKCSGPYAAWRTSSNMASIVGRAECCVKEALKCLGAATQKALDGITLEHRINGERNELFAKLGEHDLRRQLDEANAEIVKLRAENAELKHKVALLEGRRPIELPSSSVAAKADQYFREQSERLEKEEAEQVAPSNETHGGGKEDMQAPLTFHEFFAGAGMARLAGSQKIRRTAATSDKSTASRGRSSTASAATSQTRR